MKITGVILICLILSSCKYEDGPSISLRSASKRVAGNYEINKFEYNGNDSTTSIRSQSCYGKITFVDKEEIFYMNRGTNSCLTDGQWHLGSSNTKINIRFLGNFTGIAPWGTGYTANYDILELRDEKMTLVTNYNGNNIRIELSE